MEIKYKVLTYNDSSNALDFAYNEMINNNQIDDNCKNRLLFKKLNLNEIDNDILILIGAYDNKNIVGLIGYTNYSINLLYVNKKYQRKGIATKLLKFALMDLKEKKRDIIKLDSTEEGLKFYEHLGFIKIKKDNSKYQNMILNIKDTIK